MACTVHYSVPEHDDVTRYSCESPWNPAESPEGLCWAAEVAAENYHDSHDGWEARWPLVFVLWTENEGGQEIGQVSVDREAQPVFTGRL